MVMGIPVTPAYFKNKKFKPMPAPLARLFRELIDETRVYTYDIGMIQSNERIMIIENEYFSMSFNNRITSNLTIN